MRLTYNITQDFNASGSDTSTTGSISLDTNTLTLNSALNLQQGQGISIYGAGSIPSSQIPNPTTAPYLTQNGGNTGFTAGQIIYLAYAYRDSWGNLTAISPSASITIATNGNKVQMLIPSTDQGVPWGVTGVMVCTGSTESDLVEYNYWNLDGGQRRHWVS